MDLSNQGVARNLVYVMCSYCEDIKKISTGSTGCACNARIHVLFWKTKKKTRIHTVLPAILEQRASENGTFDCSLYLSQQRCHCLYSCSQTSHSKCDHCHAAHSPLNTRLLIIKIAIIIIIVIIIIIIIIIITIIIITLLSIYMLENIHPSEIVGGIMFSRGKEIFLIPQGQDSCPRNLYYYYYYYYHHHHYHHHRRYPLYVGYLYIYSWDKPCP